MFRKLYSLNSVILILFISTLNSSQTDPKCNELGESSSEEYIESEEDSVEETPVNKHPGLQLQWLISYMTDRLTNRTHSQEFTLDKSVKEFGDQVFQLRDVFSKLNVNLGSTESRLRQSGFEFLMSLNVSNQCFQSLVQMIKAIKARQLWPFKCKLITNTSLS